jgi:D-arabinose 1-dehydrogenase-like Zn-dependent alcohol dehydrogenase
MATYRAILSTSASSALTVSALPRPTVIAGSVIVRILASTVVSYMRDVLTGKRPYPLTYPFTPGGSAIGRIEDVGPDAVSLKPGQLVLVNVAISGRDDPSVTILLGLHGGGYPAATKLMEGEWRNGTYAELVKLPLENVYPLNEDVLVTSMNYSIPDLLWLTVCVIPLGGLMDIEVTPGDTVIVAPATGRFGSAAVMTALAMGATVIAAGRNEEVLKRLSTVFADSGRLKTVVLTGDLDADSAALKNATPSSKGADAYIDFSPPSAVGSNHITASLTALKPFGRCVFMGGIMGDVSLSYSQILFKCLRIQGRFMYSRKHVLQLISMAESGLLKVGGAAGISDVRSYGLNDIEKALEEAEKSPGWGRQVVLEPWSVQ